MSLKSSNKVETNRYELEIEIAAEDFEKAVNKAFKKNVKKISLKKLTYYDKYVNLTLHFLLL